MQNLRGMGGFGYEIVLLNAKSVTEGKHRHGRKGKNKTEEK